MAAAAAMMRERGYHVTGSDEKVYPPMSDFLAEMDIAIFQGYRASNLSENPDMVVIGNAMSRGNREVEAVLERKLHYTSLPELLKEFFIRGKRSMVVAGTHGKTTTSSLLSWIFHVSGRDPSYLVGGIPLNFNAGFRLGKGEFIVLEGDEYDSAFFDKRPKFLHYLPDAVILHNIEFDHSDIYRDIEDLLLSFNRLVHIVPRNGRIMANADDRRVIGVARGAFCPVVTYGLKADADWTIASYQLKDGLSEFEILRRGEPIGLFSSRLLGEHNLSNILAAVSAASEEGIELSSIRKAVETFKGVRRRLERMGERAGVTLYDDFAHHPTAIRATLTAMREAFQRRRLWAIFEPRSNTTRKKIFQKELSEAFDGADIVIIAGIHRADGLDPKERLDPEKLVNDIRRISGKEAHYIPLVDDIVALVSTKTQEGDIVAIMSNGGFGGIQGKLQNALSIKQREEDD
jgi:UDP-N-acetylmuramate: L-alanyl-gamma-D-glutamyl-meso-diaminopimelate ligase